MEVKPFERADAAKRDRTVGGMRGRAASVLSRALLVTLFVGFAWANFQRWRTTGEPSGLGTTLLEGWVAVLFLIRRPTRLVSSRRLAWVAAPIGSFAMLLARPAPGGIPQLPAEALQLLGVAVALLSLGTLGRSFGLVAANRGLKTRGPYALVRHPAYTGYLIAYSAYCAENPSVRNIVLLLAGTAFQLVRIREEEQLLSADEGYRDYTSRVRFRLVPYVY
jgi:protein-S-isoprenylcysteine O-methyltransferase Ste14